MGYETGIDLDGLIAVAQRVQEIIGRELPGQVMKAGTWNRRYKVPHTVEERLVALTS
jgi:hydroxymethylglutaryl-CoA lyase